MLQLLNHMATAYNLARWLTQDHEDAEDAVQEAYLRAIRYYDSFDGGDGKSWLLTIVRNCCYDSARLRHIREQDAPFEEELHNPRQTNPDPETSLLQKERVGLLRDSIAELPWVFREALVLRELEGLTYKEIASIAGVPMGTVMSRLSRARERLQQLLLVPTSEQS